jgi:hypothetical protein
MAGTGPAMTGAMTRFLLVIASVAKQSIAGSGLERWIASLRSQ